MKKKLIKRNLFEIEPLQIDPDYIPVSHDQLKAEKKLASAILGRSLMDILGQRSNSGINKLLPHDVFDAKNWIMSDNQDVGSYLWICRILNIRPGWIREWLENEFPAMNSQQRSEIRRELSFIFWGDNQRKCQQPPLI